MNLSNREWYLIQKKSLLILLYLYYMFLQKEISLTRKLLWWERY